MHPHFDWEIVDGRKDTKNLDEALRSEVESAIELYERINSHHASRTRGMIEELGEIEALSRLMETPKLQQGFKVLRDKKQLDKSFEAIVVRFRHLFNENAINAAQWRLDHPYDLL